MECGWLTALMVSAAFLQGPSKTAKHVDLAKPIGRLLDFSAEPSAKSLKEVEHAYRSLPAATRNKPQVKYAYAVALIRQRRLQDASRLLHEIFDEQPAELSVWWAKVWIELEMDERTRAMTDLEELASRAAAHQQSGAERFSDKDSAKFFGAVCGFLVGPWSHKVSEADAKKIEDQLRGVFDDDSQAVFDEAKTKVVNRYQKLFQEHEQRVHSELAAKTKELDDAKESVGRKAQDLGKKQQALKDKIAKRDADKKTKIGDIEAELKKIDVQRQALLMQIAPLEAQRAALVAQLAPDMMYPFMSPQTQRGMVRYNMAMDIATRGGAAMQNRQVRRTLASLVTKLTGLEGQVTSLNQRELELRGEGFATEVKHQTDLGKLTVREQALDKDRKRIKYDAQRLKAKSAATSPQLRAEADQLSRFATYSPFPFESEKEHLLAEPK